MNLWPNLTGGEVIDLLGRLRGGLNIARRSDLIERFQLDPRKKARTYSKGKRQRVAIIAALACDAELLILDEPTSSLDPLMESVFSDCLRAEREQGRTVSLSSHILSEVERLCDRVSIIRAGRLVETGSLAHLQHLTRTSISAEVDTVPAGLTAASGVHDLVTAGHRLTFDVDNAPARRGAWGFADRGSADTAGVASYFGRAVPSALRHLLRSGTGRPMTAAAVARRSPTAGRDRFAGLGTLVRFFIRRERLLLSLWALAVAGTVMSSFGGIAGLYPTDADRSRLAGTISTDPAFLSLTGPVTSSSLGGVTAWRVAVLGGLAVASMTLLTVVRRTRSDEEACRAELLVPGVLGATPCSARRCCPPGRRLR